MTIKAKTAKQRLEESGVWESLTNAQRLDVVMVMQEHTRMAVQRARKVLKKEYEIQ